MNIILPLFVSICFLNILHNVATKPEGSFILTSPRVIDAGNTAYFTLTVFDVPRGGTVNLQLTHEKSNVLIAENQVEVYTNHNMWVEINVPPMSSDVSAKLHVLGSFSNGYQIEAFRHVDIRHNTLLIFVQTDKPLYKPGQTIRFRVLPMDNQLKPLDANTVGDVWIEDPAGVRVSQWKEVKFTEGIKQFDLPLSEEPPLGTWNIKTLIKQVTTTQTFKVQKYELPKFEVQIILPKVIMADAETILIKICAKYTFGKIVEGNLKARVAYKKIRRLYKFRNSGDRLPSVEHQSRLTGCDVFRVNTDDLLLQTEEFGNSELEVFAEVTENITGIVRNATTSFKTSHEHVKLEFLEDDNYFKPKLPYTGLLQAKKPDGSPATSEKIEICIIRNKVEKDEKSEKKKCLIFTTNKEGMIQFTIKPSSPPRDIRIEAKTINYEDVYYTTSKWALKLMKSTASKIIHPWHSPSDSYLHIEPSTNQFQCDKAQKVKVQYTAERGTSIKFYHQVLSKGRIVQQGSHQRTFYSKVDEMQYDFEDESSTNDPSVTNSTDQTEVGEFILTFDTKATMSPKARLLIFYIRKDKEVVADSRMFHIKKCLQNKVSLDFRHEQQYPNTEAAMLLSASPTSLCGISMVDKSIRLLEDDTTFSTEKIFKTMESYDIGKKSSFPRMCMEAHGENMLLSPSYTTYSMQLADASTAFEEAGIIVMTDLKIQSLYNCPIYPYAALPRMNSEEMPVPLMLSKEKHREPVRRKGAMRKTVENTGNSVNAPEEIRNYFPETWLWEMQTVGSSGETAVTRQLPHTITEWVGGAVCVHPKTGLGISDVSSITTFQPFFIDFQLPYSVIRGETLPLIVTVFNYLSECLPIKLSLEPSEEYVLLSETRFQKVCVCGGKSTSVRFPLRPSILGKVNITAYGFSIEQDDEICGNDITARLSARDAITKALLVEAEGFPKEEIFNYFICPGNTNGSYSTDVPLLPPDDMILDSARAYMTITGDVMGPALNGLKKLVRLPVGCGEQNMVLFVPNIFVIDYLTSTRKITEDIKEECLNNMKTGYQRELRYRHADGSYSAFGSSDKVGSLWLTAFVLRSFGQARRFINIDENDLSLSRAWILKLQLENGCFRSSGTVFHKEMKGGLQNGDQTLAPLTSYVLISLLESDAENPDSLLVRNALKCLETEKQIDTYALSLFAYASALSKQAEMTAKYLEELDKRAISKDYVKFWESSSDSKSIAVEIAGYYTLARFKLEDSAALEKVLAVVRWITQQRNSKGGFVSTQDTVVALQALSIYATYESKKPLDIALAVESDDLTKGFKLDENNKLVTQSLKIPDLPTTVDLDAYGDGCAIVQFSLRYNVEKIANSEGLELNINARRRGSNECNLPSLGICMRYALHKEKTNMAVLSVKLPSGFAADEWSLLLLANDGDVQLMRHEINENEVNLYFEEITNEAKCFEFNIKSVFDVEDIKPSIIRLYDYYQPERQVTKDYLIPSACNTSALPDIPWLPMFSPITEGENLEASELQDLSNVDFQEMPDKAQTQEPLEEIENTSLFESFTESPPFQPVGGHFEDAKIFPDIDFSENKSSDISSDFFLNFVDTDQELDFPDGLEGNIPVSVTPPPDFKRQNCPVCSDSFSENFTAVYCNSAFALKVTKKDSISKAVKILYDVSFYMDNPKSIKKFGELEYDDSCVCPQLLEENVVLFIVGSPLSLWESDEKKHKLHLTRSVHVLLLPQRQLQSFLTEAKTLCADDP